MAGIEWTIVIGFTVLIVVIGAYGQRFVKNTADFLVAGRTCGRYLGATAGEAASMGAITIIAFLQAVYAGGPVALWSMIVTIVVYLVISVLGWGIYRLRETQVMTINELLEKRYSKKLRIFCGILCFVSGVLNMGIFPIVTGRFIVYFCQLPLAIDLGAISFPTVWLTTGLLVAVSLFLAYKGGQISLILTDFLQWAVMMIMFVAIGIAVYRVVNWDHIGQALIEDPNAEAMVDPFLPSTANAFGLWYCLMFAFRAFYNVLSWAPSSVRSQSATEAREAKLMWILSYIRQGANIGLIFGALACFAFMRLSVFADVAASIEETLGGIANAKVRSEMAVPVFLSNVLPVGLRGLLMAGIVAASISTLDTYFLSWAGVFVQDVWAPLKKQALDEKQRLALLRYSVAGVAIFVYIFSLTWKQTDYIWMYFAITGSIYTGGAGSIILGALYWKKATTQAAWAAMITGSGLAIFGVMFQAICQSMSWWPIWLNGMWLSVIASLSGIAVFLIVSLLTCKSDYDLDALLNRKDANRKSMLSQWGLMEKIIAVITFMMVVAVTWGFWYSRTHDVAVESWVKFWKYFTIIIFAYSIPVAIWFLIGSIIDLKNLFKSLLK